jgi:hypothetical protein
MSEVVKMIENVRQIDNTQTRPSSENQGGVKLSSQRDNDNDNYPSSTSSPLPKESD